jgi:CRISPR system Cascade subunit CasD
MTPATGRASLVLRLAGPLQSWGAASQFNRRETAGEPTKGGITGLLAAAQGRRRADPIEDLLALRLGVRTDQPGSLLRDYHTVSDYRGVPLLSASVKDKGKDRGKQTPTSPAKYTHVTQRYYLQDAVFVAALTGPTDLLTDLAEALRRPAFPLALGRRACVPTQPLLLRPPAGMSGSAIQNMAGLWDGGLTDVLSLVPWQASAARLQELRRTGPPPAQIDLPVVMDDVAGNDVRVDLPRSFAPTERGFASRRVCHTWARVDTPFQDGQNAVHDPFALLGW